MVKLTLNRSGDYVDLKICRGDEKDCIPIEEFNFVPSLKSIFTPLLVKKNILKLRMKSPVGVGKNYITGLYYFIKWLYNPEEVEATKKNIWLVAKVAYYLQSTIPLRNMDNIASLKGDDYFWLYLSHDFDFFMKTMNIELVRTRDLKLEELDLVEIKDPFNLEEVEVKDNLFPAKLGVPLLYTNFESEDYKTLRISEPYPKANDLYSNAIKDRRGMMTISEMFKGNIMDNIRKYYGSDTETLLKIIASSGGVIAGGFVNSVVYPTFDYFPENLNSKIVAFDHFMESKGLDKWENNDPLRKVLDQEDIEYLERKYVKSTFDIYENLMEYFSCNYDYEYEEDEDWDRANEIFGYILKDYIFTINGKKYVKFFHYSRDIDVFLTGPEAEKKASLLVKNIFKSFSPTNKAYFSRCATSIELSGVNTQVQIIKRQYTNIQEILAGFDIDASRIAIYSDAANSYKVIATPSYINSVKYGINIIVPSRQSMTFNQRLSKYTNKGFHPYIPGRYLERFVYAFPNFEDVFSKPSDMDIYFHTIYELHFLLSSDYVGKCLKPLEEYDEFQFEHVVESHSFYEEQKKTGVIPIDKRVELIREGKLRPTLTDLLYLLNGNFNCHHHSREYEIKEIFITNILKFISASLVIGWIKTNPGSQITGSFNPTNLDYLGGENYNPNPVYQRIVSPVKSPIRSKLLPEMVDIIQQYKDSSDDIAEIYQFVSELTEVM